MASKCAKCGLLGGCEVHTEVSSVTQLCVLFPVLQVPRRGPQLRLRASLRPARYGGANVNGVMGQNCRARLLPPMHVSRSSFFARPCRPLLGFSCLCVLSLHVHGMPRLHTSAWNTCVVGRKRWALFPPETRKDVWRGWGSSRPISQVW